MEPVRWPPRVRGVGGSRQMRVSCDLLNHRGQHGLVISLMMITHHPSFVEGGPYWSTKRTLHRLLVRFPEYKSILPLLACRLTGGRRINNVRILKFAGITERCETRRDTTLWEEKPKSSLLCTDRNAGYQSFNRLAGNVHPKQDGRKGQVSQTWQSYASGPCEAVSRSDRTCLASIWFTTPIGRGKRLKPVQVSVRIRSELPLI